MIQPDLQRSIENHLTAACGQHCRVILTKPVGGGSVNRAFYMETNLGPYFLKMNHAILFPRMFEAEARGLDYLRLPGTLHIPKVIAHGALGDEAFIVLEWIEEGTTSPDFWHNFGRSIAQLHQLSANTFGLDHRNYIGSLPQNNKQKRNWVPFFRENRLAPLVKLAVDSGKMPAGMASRFERLYKQLDHIFPDEPAALLHGDLWSGNFLCAPDGKACIFDPAVYFGHREMDLAMTHLFGGYNPSFYDAYNEQYPLLSGWKNRIPICNLYPLLVHVNLFGGGYLSSVQNIVEKF